MITTSRWKLQLRGGQVGEESKAVLSPKGEEDIQEKAQENRQVDCELEEVRQVLGGESGGFGMTDIPPLLEKAAPVAKGAQILQLVKDNQLVTAAIVFVLWQAGALAEALAFAGC